MKTSVCAGSRSDLTLNLFEQKEDIELRHQLSRDNVIYMRGGISCRKYTE